MYKYIITIVALCASIACQHDRLCTTAYFDAQGTEINEAEHLLSTDTTTQETTCWAQGDVTQP